MHIAVAGQSKAPILAASLNPKEGLFMPLERGDDGHDEQGQLGGLVATNHAAGPRQNVSTEPDEEAEVYGQTRMLQDPTGRLRT